MFYDPESPIQDADIEMASLVEAANRERRLRKRGICTHGSLQCPPGHRDRPTNVCTCLNCGKVWPTVEEAYAERREILHD